MTEKLTNRFKFLFSMGDISMSMPLTVATFYALIFMVNVAGMTAAQAGTAILIGKIWDAFNDPLFGVVSDRIKSKRGRRRVVLFFATIPYCLAFIMLFIVPDISSTAKVFFYAAAFIFFDTLYTAVNVSYNALTPVITQDYDERSSLNGFRMAFSIFGGLLGIVLVTVLSQMITDQRTLYMSMAILIAILTAIPIYVAYHVSEPYDSNQADQEPLPGLEAIRATLANRPFWWLMGLYLFSWSAVSLIGSVFLFYAYYYLKVPEQANFFILVSQVSGICCIPLMVWLAKKFDKRRAFMMGCVWWIVNSLLIATAGSTQIGLVYLLAATGGIGIATAYFLPWAMIPDIVELDELETGQRREGSFYAFANFFQKMGTGLIVWLFGITLSARGFIEAPNNATIEQISAIVQPESAIGWIRLAMGIVPAVLILLSIACAWFYPITRESHEQALNELASQ